MRRAGAVGTVMVPAELAPAPAADLGARVRTGRLPSHQSVLYAKDLAITVVVLLALPYLVHRLLTRPGTVLGKGPSVAVS